MTKEAMKQALEALEFEASGWEDVPPITRDAITTLREALETEQPSHQEVDWEKLYRLEVKKKEALAAKYERDIKPLTKIVPMTQPAQQQEPVGDDRVMTVVYRNVQKEDAQSFTDHPKAVWFGWCHAPYQRDDAIFKLEKAITSPPASKPWVGLTDEEIAEIECVEMKYIGTGEYVIDGEYEFARAIETKLREKNT